MNIENEDILERRSLHELFNKLYKFRKPNVLRDFLAERFEKDTEDSTPTDFQFARQAQEHLDEILDKLMKVRRRREEEANQDMNASRETMDSETIFKEMNSSNVYDHLENVLETTEMLKKDVINILRSLYNCLCFIDERPEIYDKILKILQAILQLQDKDWIWFRELLGKYTQKQSPLEDLKELTYRKAEEGWEGRISSQNAILEDRLSQKEIRKKALREKIASLEWKLNED